ncbi:MAG: hypothetical protein V4618_13355 [Pseudomonadota bacterium]
MAMALSPASIGPKIWTAVCAGARHAVVATRTMGAWFVPMFLTAALTAYLSYFYNQKSNTELAVQQQTFSDLQSFRNSGAELDQSLGALSDALVDGKDVDQAKAKMRSAISRHISDAVGNDRTLGPNSVIYINGLAKLRLTVDAVDPVNIETGATLWEHSLKLMSQRKKMVTEAQLRLVSK